jgi:hypothetical protein
MTAEIVALYPSSIERHVAPRSFSHAMKDRIRKGQITVGHAVSLTTECLGVTRIEACDLISKWLREMANE